MSNLFSLFFNCAYEGNFYFFILHIIFLSHCSVVLSLSSSLSSVIVAFVNANTVTYHGDESGSDTRRPHSIHQKFFLWDRPIPISRLSGIESDGDHYAMLITLIMTILDNVRG